jgi:beta-phosphoglucomutase-like phosphatase (HAD superfamily)
MFDYIKSSHDALHTKLAPDIFQAALKGLELRRWNAIVFEDSPKAVLAP